MNGIRLRARILQYISIAMVIILVVITALLLSENSVSRRSMEEVQNKVISLFENPRAQESSGRILRKYYGLSDTDFEAVTLYFPVSNMDAEELLIIKLKDVSQADMVRAAIEERNETQKGIFEGYAPEQLALCEAAVTDVRGNYVLYVVHEDAASIDEAFRAAVKNP